MLAVPFGPEALAELVGLVDRGVISSSVAKDVFEAMWTTGQSAQAIVDREGLAQIGDVDALGLLVSDTLARHADVVAQYRAGKTAAMGFLVGQVMKASGGKADPKRVADLVKGALA
jgi:aspartyl-tRNA(Asn)/glutamyl-tRNA(Gln) amidotransferase subunit B